MTVHLLLHSRVESHGGFLSEESVQELVEKVSNTIDRYQSIPDVSPDIQLSIGPVDIEVDGENGLLILGFVPAYSLVTGKVFLDGRPVLNADVNHLLSLLYDYGAPVVGRLGAPSTLMIQQDRLCESTYRLKPVYFYPAVVMSAIEEISRPVLFVNGTGQDWRVILRASTVYPDDEEWVHLAMDDASVWNGSTGKLNLPPELVWDIWRVER